MEPRNEKLWRMAHRRVAFRNSAYAYLLANAMLWAIWWFTIARSGNFDFPWPLWVMLGWGVGLARQYYFAYSQYPDDAHKENMRSLKASNNRLNTIMFPA